jgi:hypothetical protein
MKNLRLASALSSLAHPRLGLFTPKALANSNLGLLQPQAPGEQKNRNAESVGQLSLNGSSQIPTELDEIGCDRFTGLQQPWAGIHKRLRRFALSPVSRSPSYSHFPRRN